MKQLTQLEQFAAASWLAGIPLVDLKTRVSFPTFQLFRRIYCKLDAQPQLIEYRDAQG